MCRKRLDLAFLVDGSGSIEAYGRGNFRRCLNFVKRVVASFHISPRHTRVGVVLFSSRAWLVLNFRSSRNKHGVLNAISRIRYPRGGTRIGLALRFARYKLFNRRTNRRKVSVPGLGFSFIFSYKNCFKLPIVSSPLKRSSQRFSYLLIKYNNNNLFHPLKTTAYAFIIALRRKQRH